MKEVYTDNKEEFLNLIREIFIPYMVEIGHKDFVQTYRKEIFTQWDMFCTDKISVSLKKI